MALAAALIWASSVILFKRSEAILPQGMNLFKNLVGIALLSVTMSAMGLGFDAARPTGDWLLLGLSGLAGLGLADTLFFMALRRLGPSRLAVVECAYAPMVVVLSVVTLGERIGLPFALGAALVVGGVLLTLMERVPEEEPRLPGVLLGLAAIAAMAAGVVLAKRPLEHGHLVEVTLVRLIAGVSGQLLWILLDPRQRPALMVLRPQRVWGTLIPASVMGSYVAMLLWLGGYKWADASVAAVLNQTSTIFTILLAWIFLGESLSRQRALGAALALAGVGMILVM